MKVLSGTNYILTFKQVKIVNSIQYSKFMYEMNR